MMMRPTRGGLWCLALAVVGFASGAHAQETGTLAGMVVDPLGAGIPAAVVTVSGTRTGQTTADAAGRYELAGLPPGRYRVAARASGFSEVASDLVFLGAGERVTVDVALSLGPLQQAVVVTASASALPQSQTGAPVSVVDRGTLDALNAPALIEALRLIPGSYVEQIGGRGGTASMFIRGGGSSFAKVLIDGVAANDIGGFFDFSVLQTTAGVERIEVLRQANSVMYGSDALTGVVNLETRRGQTRIPEVTFAADGGNLGTFHNTLTLGGAVKRMDYFSEYSYVTTDNHTPNNDYRNHMYAGRAGIALGRGTNLSGTLRHIDTRHGSPNGISLFGIADDSRLDATATYAGLAVQSQWTDRWQTTLRLGSSDQTTAFLNPTPTGTPFDPFGFGANYLGDEVTITGANGYTATGRAILDFGGAYPSAFESRMTRRAVSGQTTYMLQPGLSVSGGARAERESGFGDPDADPTETRVNGGAFIEVRSSLGRRVYVSAGVGYEHNEVFRSATTPRVSLAAYVREPTPGAVGDTKVTFNAGTGIKAPSVFQAQSSLFTLVQGTPAGERVGPIGPERSRSVDVGIEQGVADGQVRLRVSFFHNRFEDLIEFVSQDALPQVGVPPDIAQATPGGAYVNASSFTAQGVEASAEAQLMTGLRLMASYTFMDAQVTASLASSALQPAFNPSIPGVAIGAYSPLVGARPFRRPANSGTLMASYVRGPGQVSLSTYFAGRRDSSTFLSDAFFGNSLLLPNEDLEGAYQKVDLGGAYRVHARLRLLISVENLLDQAYESSFGFPSLPRTVRAGLSVVVGGD